VNLEWGSVPIWIGTIVASTSALLAVVSYRRSVRDKEREQASKVSAWATLEGISLDIREGNVASMPFEYQTTIYIANRSDGPIYDVEVTHPYLSQLSASEIPPGKTGTAKARFTDPTMTNVTWTQRPGGADGEDEYDVSVEVRGRWTQPAVIFTDALGRRWERTPDRRLRSHSQRRTDFSRLQRFTVKSAPGN
jgi:hypothetical protein